MAFKERRRAQRVDANLAITIAGGAGEARGTALNISTNGVYFESPNFIEPLTKVKLDLMIPESPGSKKKESAVSCEGIVVRVEPETQHPSVSRYKVAVFFTLVPESSQKVLTRYIKSRLTA